MRPGICSADYVHIPATETTKERMSVAHRRRLGIPDGHCRIYGEFVALDRAEPLRSYAYDVARRRGYDGARAFVVAALRSNAEIERPYPARDVFYGPYLPPREFARLRSQRRAALAVAFFARGLEKANDESRRQLARALRAIERFARWSVRRSRKGVRPVNRLDWELAVHLKDEGMTSAEIAAYFGVGERTIRYTPSGKTILYPERKLRGKHGRSWRYAESQKP